MYYSAVSTLNSGIVRIVLILQPWSVHIYCRERWLIVHSSTDPLLSRVPFPSSSFLVKKAPLVRTLVDTWRLLKRQDGKARSTSMSPLSAVMTQRGVGRGALSDCPDISPLSFLYAFERSDGFQTICKRLRCHRKPFCDISVKVSGSNPINCRFSVEVQIVSFETCLTINDGLYRALNDGRCRGNSGTLAVSSGLTEGLTGFPLSYPSAHGCGMCSRSFPLPLL